MFGRIKAMPGGFHADHADIGIIEERVEQADGVGTAADRRDQQIGQAAFTLENLGARLDALRVRVAHEGELEWAKLRERSLMLAYKHSHLQTLRLQYTSQGQAQGLDKPVRHALQLQYVLGFGAHPAHAY
jgi:hypothetical protein